MVELKCKKCGGLITPKTNKIGICTACNSEIVFEQEFEEDDLLATEEYRRANCKRRIKSVSAYGSNDANDSLPVMYSSVLNTNIYDAINFEIELLEPFESYGDVEKGLLVYNEANDLIYDKISEIAMEPGFDTICSAMYLEFESGRKVPPGNYLVICWVGDSRAERFKFKVVDTPIESNTTTKAPSDIVVEEPKKQGFFKRLFG